MTVHRLWKFTYKRFENDTQPIVYRYTSNGKELTINGEKWSPGVITMTRRQTEELGSNRPEVEMKSSKHEPLYVSHRHLKLRPRFEEFMYNDVNGEIDQIFNGEVNSITANETEATYTCFSIHQQFLNEPWPPRYYQPDDNLSLTDPESGIHLPDHTLQTTVVSVNAREVLVRDVDGLPFITRHNIYRSQGSIDVADRRIYEGMGFDGNWKVLDRDNRRVLSYTTNTGLEISGRSYNLDAANTDPKDMFTFGGLDYVLDSRANRVFVYNNGRRLTSREIDLSSVRNGGWGAITVHRNRLYIYNFNRRFYVFNTSNRARVQSREFLIDIRIPHTKITSVASNGEWLFLTSSGTLEIIPISPTNGSPVVGLGTNDNANIIVDQIEGNNFFLSGIAFDRRQMGVLDSSSNKIYLMTLDTPDMWFAEGVLINKRTNESVGIKKQIGRQLTMYAPFRDLQPNDTVELITGYDGSYDQSINKIGNWRTTRAFPFIKGGNYPLEGTVIEPERVERGGN